MRLAIRLLILILVGTGWYIRDDLRVLYERVLPRFLISQHTPPPSPEPETLPLKEPILDMPEEIPQPAAPREEPAAPPLRQEPISPLSPPSLPPRAAEPEPLTALKSAPTTLLTSSGIIHWTNTQRAQNGSPALFANEKLERAALAKVQDMFEKQYFAHESPTGVRPADLATTQGYEFLLVGENLALGNFGDDERLVQAWMDSPGHRANIVNGKYAEIGVAAQEGIYEGKRTWLAVQEFGRPSSLCPTLDPGLRQRIEAFRSELEQLRASLDAKRADIESTSKENREEYNRTVEEYNAQVDQHNALLAELRAMVSTYNQQVSAYNACAGP